MHDLERERKQRNEDWAMGLLLQHAPEQAREYILRDEKKDEAPPADLQEERFLIEDPWFSDKRQLHERLGISAEAVERMLGGRD